MMDNIFIEMTEIEWKQSGVVQTGGVSVAVKKEFWFKQSIYFELKDIWVTLSNNKGFSFIICAVYLPPESPFTIYCTFFEKFDKYNYLQHKSVILLGDFNVSECEVAGYSVLRGNIICKELNNFLAQNGLIMKNSVLNCNGRTLDLIIKNINELLLYTSNSFLGLLIKLIEHSRFTLSRINQILFMADQFLKLHFIFQELIS